jgi:hypothetical protein
VDSDDTAARDPATELNSDLIDVLSGGEHSWGEALKVSGNFDQAAKIHCMNLSILINLYNHIANDVT